MLEIKRKQGERIMIGDDIVVKIVEVSGSTVQVGIVAPLSYTIYREEIWNRVREERLGGGQVESPEAADIDASSDAESESAGE